MRSKKYLGLFSVFQYKLIALLLFLKIIFLSFLIARETSADSCKCRFSFNAYSVDIIIISTLKCRPDPINGANYDTNQPFGCNYIYSRDLQFPAASSITYCYHKYSSQSYRGNARRATQTAHFVFFLSFLSYLGWHTLPSHATGRMIYITRINKQGLKWGRVSRVGDPALIYLPLICRVYTGSLVFTALARIITAILQINEGVMGKNEVT